ncbi:hypothetical protein S40293_09894 [Stachybotrys chartarum IBT 40293]|nr:hypothetical protein S40293_09894 [Stachybotrys chartarum IBT 40293]
METNRTPKCSSLSYVLSIEPAHWLSVPTVAIESVRRRVPRPPTVQPNRDRFVTTMQETIIVGGVSDVDSELYVRLDHYQKERDDDITGRPDFEPVTAAGPKFYPLQLQQRPAVLAAMPAAPVDLFHQFIPVSLIEKWVIYTNEAPEPERGPGPGSRTNQRYKKQPSVRGQAWKPTTVPEIYLWLAMQIYIGLHRESCLEDYWKASGPESHLPIHPIIKLMTFDRFQLLSRRIRISSHTTDPGRPFLPCADWSDHIQAVSLQLWSPGTDIAVDECIIGFEGRAYEKTTVPNKPTPTGFKIWVVAQRGYFLQWLFHTPRAALGPAGLPRLKKRKIVDSKITLNPTQTVVVSLVSRLPGTIYHVFLDNLFSSPDLFRALRDRGIAATGTCRTNCGLYKPFVVAKQQDSGKGCWPYNKVEAMPTPEGKVNQIAWKDNALVLLLSTVFTGEEFMRRVRRKPSATGASGPIRREFGSVAIKELPMLQAANDYNYSMGAVDRGDQLRATESLDHRNRRGGWRAIAWTFLLEVTLVNSYLLQQQAPGPSPWAPYKQQRPWRQHLVDSLIKLYSKTGHSRQRFKDGDTSMPLSQHNSVNRGKSSLCLGCQGLRAGEPRSKSKALRKPLSEVSANSLKKPAKTRRGCDVTDHSTPIALHPTTSFTTLFFPPRLSPLCTITITMKPTIAEESFLACLGLWVDPSAELLLCTSANCQYSLCIKKAQVTSHLRDKHDIPAASRIGVTRLLRHLDLGNPNSAAPPKDGSPEHPKLQMYKGFACLHCDFRTIHLPSMRRHPSDKSALSYSIRDMPSMIRHQASTNDFFQPIYLQTWARGPNCRYWLASRDGSFQRSPEPDMSILPAAVATVRRFIELVDRHVHQVFLREANKAHDAL